MRSGSDPSDTPTGKIFNDAYMAFLWNTHNFFRQSWRFNVYHAITGQWCGFVMCLLCLSTSAVVTCLVSYYNLTKGGGRRQLEFHKQLNGLPPHSVSLLGTDSREEARCSAVSPNDIPNHFGNQIHSSFQEGSADADPELKHSDGST